jgi:hypothetical protein
MFPHRNGAGPGGEAPRPAGKADIWIGDCLARQPKPDRRDRRVTICAGSPRNPVAVAEVGALSLLRAGQQDWALDTGGLTRDEHDVSQPPSQSWSRSIGRSTTRTQKRSDNARAVPSVMAGYARPLAVSVALQMAMPTRAIGDKTFKAGGTSGSGLFFKSAHYEKSLDACQGLPDYTKIAVRGWQFQISHQKPTRASRTRRQRE